jgi:glycosyltransferase involved in cell wall biosynthesis
MALKICFNTTIFITLKTFLTRQSEFLISQGWDVTWICGNEPPDKESIPSKVKLIVIPMKRGNDFFGAPRTIWLLYKHYKKEKYNIVQYSTPNASLYASIASRLAGIRIRVYGQWGIRYIAFDGFSRLVYKQFEKIACRNSTIIEPDSKSNLNFSVEEGLYLVTKGRVIWNGSSCGVDLKKFDIEKKINWRKAKREKLGYKENDIVIGFVGSIAREKGLNELLEACQILFTQKQDYRLLIVGYKESYHTIFSELREWLENSPRVSVLPPTNEIAQYMACMDILSLPSYREGFGMVVVEAEAMGIPVVVSNVPGPIDGMQNEVTGLVVPVKNSEKLAEALSLLGNDETKRLEFGKKAVIFVHEKFEQNEFLKKVVEDKVSLIKASEIE